MPRASCRRSWGKRGLKHTVRPAPCRADVFCGDAVSEPYKYWAFISYSHADSAWAQWLHRALEGYRIPARLVGRETALGPIPRKLFPVFRDRDELAGSAELGPVLQDALRQSRFQIVIASPNAARSRWVNEEIRYFKSLGRDARVLALIVDGEPHATGQGQPAREAFPEALRTAEPIAADARKGGDGKSNALLKLIAGILGLGFDDLRQRELQARNRRLAILASIASAVSVVTIVLAVMAAQARNDALRRQQQAEDLLQFMLGDLRGKLEPIGKLAILDAVGKKAMAYFATLEQEDLTDAALSSRATALRQIGEVRVLQGDMTGAEQAFVEALKLDEELVARHPGDTAHLRNMAESVSVLGNAYYVQGEAEQARPWMERYAALAERLVALQPTNAEWAQIAAEANQNLGALAFARKDIAAAEGHFRTAIERQRALVDAHPDNQDFIQGLSNLHGWMWSLETERRAWQPALEQASRQAELQRRLLALAGDNANYRYFLASAGVRMLRSQAQIAPLQPDAAELRETLQVTRELVELDPENVEFANLGVMAVNFLVEANIAADQLRAADAAAWQGLDLARRTHARASSNAQALRGLLLMLSQSAKVALLLNDRTAAREHVREAQALPLAANDTLQASLRLDVDVLDWWMSSGTAAEAAAQVRAAESLKRVEATGAQVRPELMLRYSALANPKQASQWFTQLTDAERRHRFLQEFCRATGGCADPTA